MEYIPLVREKTLKPVCESDKVSKNEINYHWEGYLAENDANFIVGYDYCTDAMMNMMDNLHIYKGMFELAGLDVDAIDKKILDEDKNIDEYTEDELSTFSSETKILKALQSIILNYADRERSEVIISMIDDMSEEEYFRNKAEVDMQGKKNAILRYYDEK